VTGTATISDPRIIIRWTFSLQKLYAVSDIAGRLLKMAVKLTSITQTGFIKEYASDF
jgi:hypothetical protein